MSFQAYLTNIKAKTGKSAEDFKKLAAQKGFTDGDKIKEGVKAGTHCAVAQGGFCVRAWSCYGDLRSTQGVKIRRQ